ncbi:MAG TPA: nodulation protein NodJ [Gammaproteobacteria bacterium]|jgi:lipooligosaccharide transport system permease protein|nr:nodulation protein NodJ [Acidiferrobacteraceae bacterium]MDP6399306.1 ABC transporter permease [Arenicellales bacterium]MDP6552941.1 ABC transporter permease [Arenicellales bacterium]MDP6919170.1 ABC transporter permease [Arenicellales bacterium]HCX87943.1 nodulation protein NodJ [Gammaproteobacteria bacterium]|tara:strand:+ start:21517 stop:22296 length:780 start_codon:yes stop_codon:yes gene_type:complete
MNTVTPPRLRLESLAVWRRNALVWRRLMTASLLLHFGEPLLYLLGIGYGLGRFVGEIDGMPYFNFLASGFIAWSAMNVASMESMWSVYTRMVPQQTYEAILATPAEVDDIVIGELLWCGSKSLVSGSAILAVAAVLGAVNDWSALLVIPVIFLTGVCFAAPGLIVTATARAYEYFNFYMTLIMTPMFIMCGVFYPVSSLPGPVQSVVQLLPLTHAVDIIRPIVVGQPVMDLGWHLGVLALFGLVTTWIATVLFRRRLVK